MPPSRPGDTPFDGQLVDASTGDRCFWWEKSESGISELPDGSLTFLLAENTVQSAARLLQLLAQRRPTALLDAKLPGPALANLARSYRPEQVLFPSEDDPPGWLAGEPGALIAPGVWRRAAGHSERIHPDLALLLPTSGSTGSPKMVRLSHDNILSNARAISQSLGIEQSDVAITSLPIHYSFGMSVLASNALSGATVVINSASVLEPVFWESVRAHGVTCVAGVPQTYQILKRLGFPGIDAPSLRLMIQAGGGLDRITTKYFADAMRERGGDFRVMYGQTEASPRMSCMPTQASHEKLGSVGLALAGGQFAITGMDGQPLSPDEPGEIVYTGPNVMMGYAESRVHLALGDANGDRLETGDIGYLDVDGFLYITGRSKRIVKLAGTRVSLDGIEQLSPLSEPLAAIDNGSDGVLLITTCEDAKALKTFRRELARTLRIPPTMISYRIVGGFPLLASGKPDYPGISALPALEAS